MSIIWKTPAKTFLVGEYLALQGGPAILLTTTPCFELSLGCDVAPAFHPESPAGRFCFDHGLERRVIWHDPYHGLGGLGASSAQFVASFHAYCQINNHSFDVNELLELYWEYAWSRQGQKPSGYDVVAQAMGQCVMLEQSRNQSQMVPWVFSDIDFILIHTGHKLATHEHLKQVCFTDAQANVLYDIARAAWCSFETSSSEALIVAVNAYHQALQSLHLVASTTLSLMQQLSMQVQPLAMKGCGALGSDIVLLLIDRTRLCDAINYLKCKNYAIVATSSELYVNNGLKCKKTLEI